MAHELHIYYHQRRWIETGNGERIQFIILFFYLSNLFNLNNTPIDRITSGLCGKGPEDTTW